MGYIHNIINSLDKEEELGNLSFDERFKKPINNKSIQLLNENKISSKIIEEYSESDGFFINWWKDENKKIGGELNLSPSKFLLQNEPTLKTECDMDSEMDQELRYFRLFDVPTMNSQVGFFALPNIEPSQNLYFRMVGDKWASDLDVDIDGYFKMALASKIFFYWQIVLIDIKEGTISDETKTFKKEMPKIFSDFNWDEFVALYQSLRLSK